MATKIPVTVITGFLGSGKTSLIRHLLQNNEGRRIAVLVNEFGELGIDGELLKSCQICPEDEIQENPETQNNNNIFELTNGCLCCTVQEEFYPTMQELIKRRDSIDCIVIETSGLALPKPLVKAFRWQEIRNAATVDAVITVVDCAAVAAGTFASDLEAIAAQRQEDDSLEHETPLQELFEDQLACADLVILNKTDLVDDQQKSQVVELVKNELPREVKIVSSDYGKLDPSILLGFESAVEDNLDDRPSHHDTEEDHDHDDEINSTHVILNRTFDPEKLQETLKKLAEQQEIYRIKGFVAVANKPMRLVMQGVGTRFEKFYDRPWKPEEAKQTRLVFIGRDLQSSEIESQLVAL
ncbi:cobalamin biosynthesis protein CobW [Sphaerospermopsis kisseleviana CS-549]|uniref:Cobalamin biosynthesis protein CobW n=1 Tax=Sphaerospermopsis kisseleviana CS-549 TaxID=3021783 RepID=A0ABT4ZNF2_9CYAN|nr:cobalamin biosynthesis protein CobW [Sphaerospermopsis kisseleviana]MDB9440824.1 cobalamin biosynthesis protein CobW [Sphaerospermopsis kisseleviana CS-549]BAZ81948.1 cobalamin biosynthesis protein CobW [Sphaerospermopsis kisseleviana NIES-73]